MDETKRFIRYIIPGLILFVEYFLVLSVMLFFTNPVFLKMQIKRIALFPTMANIGPAISLLIFSGGVGALLAAIYHSIIPFFPVKYINPIHKALFEKLQAEGLLELLSIDGKKKIRPNKLSAIDQWRILSSLWYSNKLATPQTESFKEASKRGESLHDIAHGLGTQLFGSIFMICFIIAVDQHYPEISFRPVLYLIPISFVLIHFIAYARVIISIETLIGHFARISITEKQTIYLRYSIWMRLLDGIELLKVNKGSGKNIL